MKRVFAVFLTLICLSCFTSCSITPAGKVEKTASDTVEESTQETNTTSLHGWFYHDTHAEILFRGQRYCKTLAKGLMIMDNRMEGTAYITSEDITDDKEAEKEGVIVHFNADQEIPDILMMSTEDYFRGDNYNKDLYYDYVYFCKKEEWSILGQKLRTREFKNLYVTYFDVGESLIFNYTVGRHELLDDDTVAAIKRTVKLDADDILDIDKIYFGDFNVFFVGKCDRNMLVDPITNEYTIFKVDGEYYIGDWYSGNYLHVLEEDEPLIKKLMEKYAFTVKMFTAYYKELISESQSVSPDNIVLLDKKA